jgi:hypothetical protein
LQQAQQGSQAKARNGIGSHFGTCVDVRHIINPNMDRSIFRCRRVTWN